MEKYNDLSAICLFHSCYCHCCLTPTTSCCCVVRALTCGALQWASELLQVQTSELLQVQVQVSEHAKVHARSPHNFLSKIFLVLIVCRQQWQEEFVVRNSHPPPLHPHLFLFYFCASRNDHDHILMPGFPFLVPPPFFFNDFVNEEQEGGG